MSANPFTHLNQERHTLRRHVLRIRNLERRPGGAGSRRVYGQIGIGGGTDPLDPGSGDWTVDPGDDSGTFTITIDPPFVETPTPIVCENEASTNPPNLIHVASVSVDTLVVETYDLTGTLTNDIGFNFELLGV